MTTTIKGEILKDGTLKFVTSTVDQENHQNAEAFMALVSKLTGGDTQRAARGDHGHAHHHHDHHHEHGA